MFFFFVSEQIVVFNPSEVNMREIAERHPTSCRSNVLEFKVDGNSLKKKKKKSQ